MEIKLNFSNEDIDKILNENGYVCENVLMWYSKHPYDIEYAVEHGELGSYYVKMAYPKNIDCPWKQDEKPLVENYKEFVYDNFVNNFVSKLILSKLL